MNKTVIITAALLSLSSLMLWRQYKQTNHTNPVASTVTIGVTGDVMLGRLVNELLYKVPPTYVWGDMLSVLKANDLNVINLETAVTMHQEAVPKVFNYKMDPQHIETLQEASIDIANLANNHVLDFGIPGLLETLKTLDRADILHTGAGRNISEAQQAAIVVKNGLRIGMIGFTDNEPTWLATADKPGTNYITVGDIATVKKVIDQVRANVDILIASFHWGPNMRERPTQAFIDFAHHVMDAGVDIFHGHSAHIFQAIELYKQKLILYDTGDFVDDYAVDEQLRNNVSFLYQVTVDRLGIKKLDLIPVYIDNMQVNQATGQIRTWALERIRMLSAERGTMLNADGSWHR